MKAFLEYIDSLTWKPGKLDPIAYNAFLRAVSLGTGAEAIACVAERILAAGGELRMDKLQHQYECACHWVQANPGSPSIPWVPLPPKPVLEVNGDAVTRVSSRIPESIITPAWLRARSPVPIWETGPAEYLWTLYSPGEYVRIFTNPKSRGMRWRIPRLLSLGDLDSYRYGHKEGVWYLIQPNSVASDLGATAFRTACS